MTGYVTVLTTTSSEAEAETIAEALLTDDLAACVQILDIRSRYVWKGVVQHEPEQLLLIKTRAALFELVRGRIRALHSYDTPEIVALPIVAGDADYLSWMAGVTRGEPHP
jgi:periplasmic divalent cation tolerance protein